jgi:small-conductance mechanosensitive channel
MFDGLSSWQGPATAIIELVVVALAALAAHAVVYSLAFRAARRTASTVDESLLQHTRHPARLLVPLLALFIVVPLVAIDAGLGRTLRHLIGLGIIGCVSWTVVSVSWVVDDIVLARYRAGEADDLHARTVETQIAILRRLFVVAVAVITIAICLLTFPEAQSLGASILASAGVAGIVIGMAARPVLSNLLAGIQIALTQPIRLEDVVVIDGEWGRIEEITTTYVVVRIWDLRRLIVPLTAIIEQPVENWTRTKAEILGTVEVHADYRVPVDEVRAELKRVLDGSDLWDGSVWGLQVTASTERTMTLRALMSSADSSASWDLRCLVRERLIGYLQEHHPGALPRLRAETGAA